MNSSFFLFEYRAVKKSVENPIYGCSFFYKPKKLKKLHRLQIFGKFSAKMISGPFFNEFSTLTNLGRLAILYHF